jgi:hypothetical protein
MKSLAALALLFAMSLPMSAQAMPGHMGCCGHHFRLIIKHDPGRGRSFAIIQDYVNGVGAKGRRDFYLVQPFCGPAYFARRPCITHHAYSVVAYESSLLPLRSWSAQWVIVRREAGSVVAMQVFYESSVGLHKPARGITTLTAVY